MLWHPTHTGIDKDRNAAVDTSQEQGDRLISERGRRVDSQHIQCINMYQFHQLLICNSNRTFPTVLHPSSPA